MAKISEYKKKKAVIFDLDGTLLNTLDDIATTANLTLADFNLPNYTSNDYKAWVGKGGRFFLKSCFEDMQKNIDKKFLFDISKEEFFGRVLTNDYFEKIYNQFIVHYNDNVVKLTKPYEGIEDLLMQLQSKNISINVLSNKPHLLTIRSIKEGFPDIKFDYVYGQRETVKAKPDPSTVFEILEKVNVLPEDCTFVGDTDTDLETAKNAGCSFIGVEWGFRPQEIEKKSQMISNASELKKYL